MAEVRLPNVNFSIISGRLTRDIELKYTPSGTAVANIDIAHSDYKKTDDGFEEKTGFYSVVVFGQRAEKCNQELSKGSPVLVEGSLSQDRWEDKDGNKRSKIKIMARKISFLEKAGQGQMPQEPTMGRDPEPLSGEIDDDQIPF